MPWLFSLSSTCLLMRKSSWHMLPSLEPKSKKSLVHDCQEMYQNAKSIFADEGGSPLWQVALLIGSHQCPWGSISGIYNLQLLHSPFFQLSFSQSLLILEAVTILSMVWAGLTPHWLFFQAITPPYPPLDRRWADHAWAHKYPGTLGHSFPSTHHFPWLSCSKNQPKSFQSFNGANYPLKN